MCKNYFLTPLFLSTILVSCGGGGGSADSGGGGSADSGGGGGGIEEGDAIAFAIALGS